MYRRIGNLSALGMILGLVVLLASCGGSPSGPRASADGRIYLVNNSLYTIETEFFNEELGELVKAVVEPGEKKEISQGLLKGGTKVTVSLTPRRNRWGNPGTRDLEITVDGNITIRASSLSAQRESDVEYTVGR